MKVVVQSFKPGGKYYTTGDYESSCKHMFEVFTEVRDRALAGDIPGLAHGAVWTSEPNRMDWVLHVDAPESDLGYPCVIVLFRDSLGNRTDKAPRMVSAEVAA